MSVVIFENDFIIFELIHIFKNNYIKYKEKRFCSTAFSEHTFHLRVIFVKQLIVEMAG